MCESEVRTYPGQKTTSHMQPHEASMCTLLFPDEGVPKGEAHGELSLGRTTQMLSHEE